MKAARDHKALITKTSAARFDPRAIVCKPCHRTYILWRRDQRDQEQKQTNKRIMGDERIRQIIKTGH